MKQLLAVLLCLVMLSAGWVVSAAPSSADEIPVVTDVPFPAAVTEMLMSKAFISGTERLTTANVQNILDSCVEDLMNNDGAMVVVPSDIVMKHPALKTRSTVECTAEYIYTTYYNQGIAYEWMYYADGTVTKTVSYTYKERTSEFKTFRYSVQNNDNQSLEKQRVEIEETKQRIHMGDFLFGMAIAVLLMMVGVLIVRAIKKT